MSERHYSMWNLRFGMLCVSSLFFSSSFNMLIPELPTYLSSLGGAEYKGLIISLFTLTAGFSRPFSGRLTDTIGRKPVMIIGGVVCLICGLLYPVLGTVAGFLLLRLFHGFSTGFTPTALATYVADIVPSSRWGEALGLQGLFFSTGLALGPAIGTLIKSHYSFNVLFYSSSIMAFISIVLVLKMKETLVKPMAFQCSFLKISKTDIIAPEVLPPAIVTFLSYLAFGMILTLIPDWSDHLGINKGHFFMVFTVSSILIRFTAGKLSDRHGRVPVVNVALVLLALALVAMGYWQTTSGLMVAATIYGLAVGMLSPALNAWTVDLSTSGHRGKAIATMYIALEAGIGLGALISGSYFQNDILKVPSIMYACALMALIGLIYVLRRGK